MPPPSGKTGLRADDIRTYLTYCDYLEQAVRGDRRSRNELTRSFEAQTRQTDKHDRKTTTTYDSLKRVVNYFMGASAHLGDSGLDRAFPPLPDGQEITDEAKLIKRLLETYEQFSLDGLLEHLRGLYEADYPSGRQPVVKLGCPEAICFRQLSSALSGRAIILSDIDLQLTIDNSEFLIPRLHAGLLDVVISYGPPRTEVVRDEKWHVSFVQLGLPARLCILHHPAHRLMLKSAPQGTRRRSVKSSPRREGPASQASAVNLAEIEFGDHPLIYVQSFNQPLPLAECVKLRTERGHALRRVESYDEALALVHMQLGIAVATEPVRGSERVEVVGLLPETEFQRSIGVYYNDRSGLSAAACRVVEILRAYGTAFKTELQSGIVPGYGACGFKEWCISIAQRKDRNSQYWIEFSKACYPRRDNPRIQ